MAVVTIHNIDDRLRARLQTRAAMNGRSEEEEARIILDAALGENEQESGSSLVTAIRKRVEPLGGFELELPERGPIRTPPDLLA